MLCFWKPKRPCLFLSIPLSLKICELPFTDFWSFTVVPVFIRHWLNPEWHIGFFLRSITTKMASSLLAIHLENCQHIPTKKLIIRSVKHATSLNSIIEELHPYQKGFVITSSPEATIAHLRVNQYSHWNWGFYHICMVAILVM